MRKLLSNITTACLTLATGLVISALSKSSIHRGKPAKTEAQITTALPSPKPAVTQPPTEDAGTVGLSPYDIEYFISSNPQADLSKLWQRLGIPYLENNSYGRGILQSCSDCKAESFEYDLDGEPGDEVLLRISDRVAESHSYLVFKQVTDRSEHWNLLGHIDAWGKYKSAQHTILISGGRSWLIIQGQGASGSGVALYFDRLFQVTKNGLREIVSYSSGGHQSGEPDGPTKEFSGHVISCEVTEDRAIVTIEFTIEYSTWSVSEQDYVTLFTKRQRAVLTRRPGGGTRIVDRTRSQVSQHEMESIYNIDSMTEEDFLKYNYSQLLEIASGENETRRRWLRSYLKTCGNSPAKRRLTQLLLAN